ncbi:zinc finger MYM-type protein 1-like, partial [Aphis craccivora]
YRILIFLYITGYCNISVERTFSKLKLIKNYLRSTIFQTRLNSLAMISIENQRAKK